VDHHEAGPALLAAPDEELRGHNSTYQEFNSSSLPNDGLPTRDMISQLAQRAAEEVKLLNHLPSNNDED
jgi:hypothetical protein